MNYRIEVNNTRIKGTFTTHKQVSNYLFKHYGIPRRYIIGLLELADLRNLTTPIEITTNYETVLIHQTRHQLELFSVLYIGLSFLASYQLFQS